MRKFTRRITAVMLSACLALSPLGAFAEQTQSMVAQVELPMADGTQMLLPVQSMLTSSGETVYWLDMSLLSEEQIAALSAAQMMLYDETGELVGQYVFSELSEDGVTELYDAIDPELTVPMMVAPMAMPESAEEAEAVLAEYGFLSAAAEQAAAEAAAQAAAEQAAAEAAAQAAAEQAAAEAAAQAAAEQAAAEAAAQAAAEQAAAEAAAQAAAEQAAAEAAAQAAAEQAAAEAAAQAAAEQAAAEAAAQAAAEQAAAEAAAQAAAEQAAAEAAAQAAAEAAAEQAQQIEVPGYVVPMQDNTNLRSEPVVADENVLMQVNASEVLIVSDYVIDGEGRVWWQAQDVRTGVDGYIMADVVGQVSENIYNSFVQQLDAERLAAEQAAAEQAAAEQAAAEQAADGQTTSALTPVTLPTLEVPAVEYVEEIPSAQTPAADMDLDEEEEQQADAFIVPSYVAPMQDNTNLRSDMIVAEETVLAQVGTGDVLAVYGYAQDGEDRIWWQVEDYRTRMVGYIMADVVSAVADEDVAAITERINAEIAAAQQQENESLVELLTPPPAQEEADDGASEDVQQEIAVPGYVVPMQDNTNLRSEPVVAEETVLMQVNASEVLIVSGYAVDGEGRVWWQAQDVRTGVNGYIMADVVGQVSENIYNRFVQQLDAELLAAEQAAAEQAAAEAAAKAAAEQAAAEQAAAEAAAKAAAEQAAAEQAAAEAAAKAAAEQAAAEQAAAEQAAAEAAAKAEQERLEAEQNQQNAVRYAVTSNRNNPTNNLREEANSGAAVVGEYPNDVLLIVGEPSDDGKWYPVTVVEDGAQGYMRDYLLTEISQADANARMADLLADKVNEGQDAEDENYPELIVPDQTQEDAAQDEQTEDTPEQIVQDENLIAVFPAYAMTLPQENGAMIVLRTAPAGELPQDGAIPMIREPSPLELTEVQLDANGQGWYLARNLNTEETGYIEAYKVEEVTKEAAEAAIKQVVSVIPPVPSDEETEEKTEEPDDEDENAADEDETTQEPEIIVPDIPQELTEGAVYHYGRNTGKQVALREEPSSNGKLYYRMEAGTVLWVMRMDGEWCHVRTDRGEGYVMAKFVELMGVNEEESYRATLDDPEIAPEVTDDNYPELITPEPTAEPTATPNAEPTATPAPQDVQRYAMVTANGTQMHASANENAYLQAMIAEEDVVYVLHSEMGDDGEMWVLVQFDGQWGYVRESSIRLMDDEEQAAYLAALEAAKATPTPTATPTATPEPTATPAPQRLELYARVINDGTPLRGNPDPNAYLQTILDQETVVFLFQSQIASDGMMWYLVQYNGQWGYIRADLVRPMGEQETADYLAQLEAELATPTPMPLVTPEPIGPDSTSAYAKLVKDKVNLRRTPSASGTSLDRIPQGTLLLVLSSEHDGTYTWYQVNYNGKDGYIRSDMAQMLTISELTDYYEEQMQQTQNSASAGTTTKPNSSNNTSIVINGSELQDLIPVDNSWTNNVISGMPSYATATPDPNATPTPVPPAKPAALIRSSGEMTVNNVPALTENGTFSVYGKTKAYSTVTATVNMTVETAATSAPASIGKNLIPTAIAESMQTIKRTVGQTVADANGMFEMDVTLPEPGEYIVEFANADGAFAQYGVTYDAGATPIPAPTAQPLPTAMPVQEEEGGMSIWPFAIGGLLILVAAAVYGVYVYRRRTEEEEDEEDEDEEAEMRQAQLNMQRQRRSESAAPKAPTSTVVPGAQRAMKTPQNQVPSYMRNTDAKAPVSPYARPQAPAAPAAPVKPQAPAAPAAPVKPQAPAAPAAPVKPQAPAAPAAPVKPQAPAAPAAPVKPQAPAAPAAPEKPQAPAAQTTDVPAEGTARRRRRPPVDPKA